MATINPFQAPINYSVDVQSPFEAALGGMKIGAGVAEIQAQAQAREQAATGQAELKKLFTNPNATAADYERVLPFLPKDQAAIATQGFERKTKEQQQNDLKLGGQVYSAVKSGQLDFAKQRLQEQADGYRNSGREADAKGAETYLQLIDINPTGAQTFIGLMMSALPGGKELLENVDKTLSTTREEQLAPSKLTESQAKAKTAQVDADFAERLKVAGLNKTNWDIKNVQSQISDRSNRLNLDSQVTAATVAEKLSSISKNINDIPTDTRKLINESAVLAATSKQSAEQFNDLAKRLDESGGGYGVFSSASDFLKKGAGFQGGMTQLRQEYTRLRNTAAIKSLPPGSSSDSDIAMALKGFPSDNASAKDLSSFLRGMAKLQDIDASINNAKTDWLSQNNGVLTRAKNTFVAGDYSTKPGETFNDFSQRIVGDVSRKYRSPEQIADEKRQQDLAKIPTKGEPAPQQVDVRSQADAILRGGR